MWVTAKTLAYECGVSERTIREHANQLEKNGIKVKSRIGKPFRYSREIFMMSMFPGWKDEEGVTHGE